MTIKSREKIDFLSSGGRVNFRSTSYRRTARRLGHPDPGETLAFFPNRTYIMMYPLLLLHHTTPHIESMKEDARDVEGDLREF